MKAGFTVQDMVRMQNDVKSFLFEKLSFVFEQMAGLVDGDAEFWRKRLLEWDGLITMNSREASVFEEWYFLCGCTSHFIRFGRLEELVFVDTTIRRSNPIFFIRIFQQNYDPACSVFNKTCIEYAALNLQKAVHHLQSNHNGRIPTWGEIHHASFSHKVLDKTPLKCLASRKISSNGGSHTGM